MDELPELTGADLRKIEAGEWPLTNLVRQKLAAHGETGGFREVGTTPERLDNWIAVYARQLLRLHALPYLKIAAADRIGDPLIASLIAHIGQTWLSSVKPETAARLKAVAERAMRDELGHGQSALESSTSLARDLGESGGREAAPSIVQLRRSVHVPILRSEA